MKKFLAFIICLVLLVGIAIPAFATDVDKIQPDGSTVIIVGETDYYYNSYYTPMVVRQYDKDTVVVYPATPVPIYYEDTTTNKDTNNNNNNNNNDDSTVLTPEEQKSGQTDETAPIDMTEHTEAEYDLIDEIFRLVNEEREKAGVKELYYDFDIQAAADLRAKESATLFDHTRPNGTSCFTVVEDVDYNVVGENLLKADKPIATAELMMKSWMESEGHRHNILLADFKSVTIGIYEKDNVVYASQIFLG